jgi:hypothetical protein
MVMQQGLEPDEILISGALMVRGGAQGAEEFLPVPDGKHRVGIAAVNRQKHAPGPVWSKEHLGGGNRLSPLGGQ